jgi:predicted flap endonuclease-1-like 5' DNA nuclease
MKRLLKFVSLVAFICAVTWVLRDHLLPGPQAPTSHPPAFRNPPQPAPDQDSDTPNVETPDDGADDLTMVNGIGPVYAGRLAAIGVKSFSDLAAADADDLAQRAELPRERIADWIGKAAELA